MTRYEHIPVMAGECLSYLNIRRDGVYIDGTVGGAGHALRILERLDGEGAVLIGIDRDEAAASVSASRLKARKEELGSGARCEVVCSNHVDIDKICGELGVTAADGILLDLGISSYQLDETDRGFSYTNDSPLDMRMDRGMKLTAADIVNGYAERDLADLFYRYGEERWAARIALFIAERRQAKPLRTTRELADLVAAAIPKGARRGTGHPARRVFQAIRIAVNDELGGLADAIKKSVDLLRGGGRLVIISFHSLEDRIVKNTFAELSAGCVCPKDFPVCVCGRAPQIRSLAKKPATPSAEELRRNPRAKSAKLRAAEKLIPATGGK